MHGISDNGGESVVAMVPFLVVVSACILPVTVEIMVLFQPAK